jgi:hypothetical protein
MFYRDISITKKYIYIYLYAYKRTRYKVRLSLFFWKNNFFSPTQKQYNYKAMFFENSPAVVIFMCVTSLCTMYTSINIVYVYNTAIVI